MSPHLFLFRFKQSKPMKNILRWIALLPGAVLGMVLANTFNSLTLGFVLPDAIDQICKSWFGSLGFVGAAYYIAPKGKIITTIVVATSYCAIGTFAVVVAIRSGDAGHPAWLEIVNVIVSIAASALVCMVAFDYENDKKSESLKESQRN
jgi:hypothetical protein